MVQMETYRSTLPEQITVCQSRATMFVSRHLSGRAGRRKRYISAKQVARQYKSPIAPPTEIGTSG